MVLKQKINIAKVARGKSRKAFLDQTAAQMSLYSDFKQNSILDLRSKNRKNRLIGNVINVCRTRVRPAIKLDHSA